MESIEVEYEAIYPFLALCKGDMEKTQDKIFGQILNAKLMQVGDERFFTYNNTNYHLSNDTWKVDGVLFGDLCGRKLRYKKRGVQIPRKDRLIALGYLAIQAPPHKYSRYFCDTVDQSFYTLSYKDNRKRWILEMRQLRDNYVLKVDKISDAINHLGVEVKEKISGEELTMAKVSYTHFNGHLIQNNLGKISDEHYNILMDMLCALNVLTQ